MTSSSVGARFTMQIVTVAVSSSPSRFGSPLASSSRSSDHAVSSGTTKGYLRASPGRIAASAGLQNVLVSPSITPATSTAIPRASTATRTSSARTHRGVRVSTTMSSAVSRITYGARRHLAPNGSPSNARSHPRPGSAFVSATVTRVLSSDV